MLRKSIALAAVATLTTAFTTDVQARD